MKEFEETYQKWRKMLLRTNMYLALLVFVVELLMYFVLKKSDLIKQSETVYLTNFLFLPTVADLLIIAAGHIIIKKISLDSRIINYIPSVQLACICFVVASVHFIFPITLSVFSVALSTTVIFSDRKMTRNMGIICSLFLALAFLHRRISPYRLTNDYYFFEDAIVAFVILIATLIICNVLIKFQEEKDNTIRQDFIIKLQMQEQLSRDPKTGLYGHGIFMNTLNKMASLSEKTNEAIALAVIDIDNFKKINDTYGHLKGDQVILTLAEIMKANGNVNRFVARYGGEEFTIILSGKEVNSAFEYLEGIRIAFERQKYNFTDKIITISIGFAIWKSGWTAEELFENADSAMYASKADRKNRTTVYSAEL